jgi:hypothetical protein
MLQVGLDGVQVLHEHTRRILRVYALDAISRWAMPDASVLTFWYKPTGEHDEQAVRVMATERINRCLLDTLTCSCLQLCEMRGIPFSSADDSSGRSEHINLLARSAGTARGALGTIGAEEPKTSIVYDGGLGCESVQAFVNDGADRLPG